MNTTEETASVVVADDEMPAPPTADASAEAAPVDGRFNYDLLQKVEKVGDVFPQGTWDFRLDRYTTGWGDESTNKRTPPELVKYGNQPYYMAYFICTKEPLVGKMLVQYVGWANQETLAAAEKGDSVALSYVRTRLSMFRTLVEGAEWRSHGRTDAAKFLDEHPELKMTLSIRDKKTKDEKTQKYVSTGQQQNDIIKVFPMYRPGQ